MNALQQFLEQINPNEGPRNKGSGVVCRSWPLKHPLKGRPFFGRKLIKAE